jgi:amino acid permease
MTTTFRKQLWATVAIAVLVLTATPAVGFIPRTSTGLSSSSILSRPKTTTAVAAAAASGAEDLPRGGAAGGASSTGGGTATIPNEVFNLVKSIVGAGVLSLPYAVAVYGNAPSALIPAVSLIALMGLLSGYTFGLIGRVCQNTKTSSYAEAWDATVGKKLSPLIAFSCFIDCFAGNLSYSMILADTTTSLLAAAGIAVTRTQSLLGVTSLVLLPLCLLKNLASLAPFSLAGIAGMLYTTMVMAFRYFGKAYVLPKGEFAASQLIAPVFGNKGASAAWSFKALILTCMLSNAYIAHFNAPKFLSELKNNTMARFHQVIGWSFATSIALYAAVTCFGFLTFGASSNGLILNNYANADKLASCARIAVTLSIVCSYPLIFVGLRDGLLDLFKVPQDKRDNALINKITLSSLGVVTIVASQLTDLGLVASVGGATFGTALVFVYPVVMFLKQQKKRTRESIPAACIGILGLIMGAIGTVLSFKTA